MLCAYFDVAPKTEASGAAPKKSKLDRLADKKNPKSAAAAAAAAAKAPVAAAQGDTQRVHAKFVPLPEETDAPRWSDPRWASSDPRWSDVPHVHAGSPVEYEWDYVYDMELDNEEEDDKSENEWSEADTLDATPASCDATAAAAAVGSHRAAAALLDRHFAKRGHETHDAVFAGPELCFEDDEFIY